MYGNFQIKDKKNMQNHVPDVPIIHINMELPIQKPVTLSFEENFESGYLTQSYLYF